MSKPRIQMVHDTRAGTPDQGHTYFHCRKCLEEMPSGVSPKEWSRQQASITETGAIQIWCTRHDMNISVVTPRVAE